MKLYAIKIRKSDSELLALLNGGVAPAVEKKETYLIFDSTNESHNAIVTRRGLLLDYPEISSAGPHIFRLKKK